MRPVVGVVKHLEMRGWDRVAQDVLTCNAREVGFTAVAQHARNHVTASLFPGKLGTPTKKVRRHLRVGIRISCRVVHKSPVCQNSVAWWYLCQTQRQLQVFYNGGASLQNSQLLLTNILGCCQIVR